MDELIVLKISRYMEQFRNGLNCWIFSFTAAKVSSINENRSFPWLI